MNCCNPEVTVSSDIERPSSEGTFTVEPGVENNIREASAYRETQVNVDAMEDRDGSSVGFGISGAAEGKVLGGISKGEDKELKYLHLLWEPGRAELCAGGVASTLRKMTGSRARRHYRMVRNLGPIGKDIYGKVIVFFLVCARLSTHIYSLKTQKAAI